MIWIRFEGKSQEGRTHYCWREFDMSLENALIEANKFKSYDLDWTAKATNDKVEITSISNAYHVVNDTFYDGRTPERVISTLESARLANRRLHIHYGDPETGEDQNEEFESEGYVGRSTGRVKSPLLIHNSRSLGGGTIMSERIVKIRSTGKKGIVLYQHSNYFSGRFDVIDNPDTTVKVEYPHAVTRNGEVVAAFKTEKQAQTYVTNVTGIYPTSG